MNKSFQAGLLFIVGLAAMVFSLIADSLLVDAGWVSTGLLAIGILITGYAVFNLRLEIREYLRHDRGELVLSTIGLIGIFMALAWLAALYPVRFDLTKNREHSLAPQTIKLIRAIDKPVHIVFFHDRGMRDTMELYAQMADLNKRITIEFFDPVLNPSQARLRGVEYAGTALIESEERKVTVNSPSETDIANGILRVTQGKQQTACFLDGHGEPDPFSLETHDHMEGSAGHSHGVETKIVNHERHGMAKARNGLETLNYKVEKINVAGNQTDFSKCTLLVVAGPQLPLMSIEIKQLEAYLNNGGNALFLLDPFVETGLDGLIAQYGVVLGKGLAIDPSSHFWADVSAPAVSNYNPHEVSLKLPLTFFPGARPLQPTLEPLAGVSVRPVVNTSQKSYTSLVKTSTDYVEGSSSKGPLTLMVSSIFSPAVENSAADIMKQLRSNEPEKTAAAPVVKTDRKPSKIIVIGDSDFATNSFFHVMGNGQLFLNAVNFLSASDNLIGLEPRTFDIPRVEMTNIQMKITFILSLIAIPLLMAGLGMVVWWKQR